MWPQPLFFNALFFPHEVHSRPQSSTVFLNCVSCSSQPRPQGLLSFQYGGTSGEDPGTQQITWSKSALYLKMYSKWRPRKRVRRSGYDIAKRGENKQNGRHGGISLKPSGTIYRPAKFFFALPFQEKWYTGNEGKTSKRRSLRNMFFLSRKHDFSKERSKLKFKLYTVSAKGLLASYIIVFSASFPTITPASNKIA